MNIKKWIPALTLAILVAAICHFSSCNPSKRTASGTGGSVRDTASAPTPVKKP